MRLEQGTKALGKSDYVAVEACESEGLLRIVVMLNFYYIYRAYTFGLRTEFVE